MLNKIQIDKAGGYDVLRLTQEPTPRAEDLEEDEILIKVFATGVNYADVCVRWGIYASAKQYIGWPITPGFEFSGEVFAKGKNVRHFQLSDKVLGVTFFGGYSNWLVVKEWQIFNLLPEHNLTFNQAASIPAVFLTAYHALFQNVVTKPGMKILIHSAAGGVGQALVQLSHILGFEITAVVGNQEKVAYVKDTLNAHHVIAKTTDNLWEKAQSIAPKGYDLICDPNGISTLKESYRHLAPMGKLIIYGFHSMLPKQGGKLGLLQWLRIVWDYLMTPRFNPLHMTSENKSIITFNLSFLFNHHALFEHAMTDILKWLEEGRLAPPLITTFPLEDVAKAHQAIESGMTQGKLVLTTNHQTGHPSKLMK